MAIDRVVQEILGRYFGVSESVSVEPLGWAGGMSGAQFWRVTVGQDGTATESARWPRFMLRRWPETGMTADRLRTIHRAILVADGSLPGQLAVPQPTTEGDRFVQRDGVFWELQPYLDGQVVAADAVGTAMVVEAMEALATLHAVWGALEEGEVAPSPGLLKRASGLCQLAGKLPKMQQALERIPRLDLEQSDALREASRRILSLAPDAAAALGSLRGIGEQSVRLQWVLRDIWRENLLFREGRLTGIVDFGQLGIDTPNLDVVRLLGSLAQGDLQLWRRGLQAYREAGGVITWELGRLRSLHLANLVLGGVNWVHWLYVEQRQFAQSGQILERLRAISHELSGNSGVVGAEQIR